MRKIEKGSGENENGNGNFTFVGSNVFVQWKFVLSNLSFLSFLSFLLFFFFYLFRASKNKRKSDDIFVRRNDWSGTKEEKWLVVALLSLSLNLFRAPRRRCESRVANKSAPIYESYHCVRKIGPVASIFTIYVYDYVPAPISPARRFYCNVYHGWWKWG